LTFLVIASHRKYYSIKSTFNVGKRLLKLSLKLPFLFFQESQRTQGWMWFNSYKTLISTESWRLNSVGHFIPLPRKFPHSYLTADFRKEFNGLNVQAEVQFGNMSRWYSDIFKFQAAYSESLTQTAVSIVPMLSLATRIDSNVANFERARRELPSANLSITLPILLIGVSVDENTRIIDVSKSQFTSIKDVTGRGKIENRWRVVNCHFANQPIETISELSPTGPALQPSPDEEEEAEGL
jgi:hypothetical protein